MYILVFLYSFCVLPVHTFEEDSRIQSPTCSYTFRFAPPPVEHIDPSIELRWCIRNQRR